MNPLSVILQFASETANRHNGRLGRNSSKGIGRRTAATRLWIEGLEARQMLSSVLIAGPSPIDLGLTNVSKGETIEFQVSNWNVSDPDDINEGEPLIIQSSGGLQLTIQQQQTGNFDYTAVADNETFSAYILGGDFDEEVTVNAIEKGIDLAVTLDSTKIVPSQATDLNLYHFFGNEQINVPVTITNQGTDPAKGNVSVKVFLNATPDLNGQPKKIGAKNEKIDLQAGASVDSTVNASIPTNSLTAGQKYYVVVQIDSGSIKERDAKNDMNNTKATDRQFEFVGTPKSNSTPFTNGLYFKFIRDTLNGTTVVDPGTNVSDPRSFIASFEGDRVYPYLDSAGIPTIGVGINLNSIGGTLEAHLAADVRAYYLANYGQDLSASTDAQIMTMLRNQAQAGNTTQAISATDDQALFNESYQQHAQIAQNAIGAAWSSLSVMEQVAIVDIVYNVGSLAGFPSLVTALQNGDFVRAGFELVNAQRTTQAPGLTRRTEAEYFNLLTGHQGDLGGFAP
jgi:GH24 family phage-related lysozyme (muramidase)